MHRYAVVTASLVLLGAFGSQPSSQTSTKTQRRHPTFVRITGEPVATDRASTGGVSWVDYDADGDVDLFVANGYDVSAKEVVPQTNWLYENRSGRFIRVSSRLSEDAGFSSGSAWADFDNDGRLDVFVPNQRDQDNFLYRNAGDLRFVLLEDDSVTKAGGVSFSATWGDADNDGFVDLFVSNGGLSGARANFLYRNRRGTAFEPVHGIPVTEDTIQSGGATWVDYDLDGDVDLFVPGREARLYRNDGRFRFTPMTDALPVVERPMLSISLSGSWGDYDNDGDFDLYTVFYHGEVNRLYVNEGNGTFSRGDAQLATLDGGASVDADWADLDNNGWLDLIVTNWGSPVHAYLQTEGRFERAVLGALGKHMAFGSGAAIADYDGDGDLDVLVGHWPDRPGEGEENHLYRNDGPTGNWLRIDLRGTTSNRSAIGARIVVETTVNGRVISMTREVRSQEGWRGQNELTAHFGLGTATSVRSIVIHWPSGKVQRLGSTRANQRITVEEE